MADIKKLYAEFSLESSQKVIEELFVLLFDKAKDKELGKAPNEEREEEINKKLLVLKGLLIEGVEIEELRQIVWQYYIGTKKK